MYIEQLRQFYTVLRRFPVNLLSSATTGANLNLTHFIYISIIILGVDALMTKKATKLELLKPFRILLNLLDKPEIGSAILEDVLVEVFKNLFFSYQHFNPKGKPENKSAGEKSVKRSEPAKQNSPRENHMEELIKTGNLLFNTFEPYFMWQYIAKLLASCNRRGAEREGNHPVGESNHEVKFPTGENDLAGKSSNGGETDEKLEILDVIRLTDFILNIVALVGFSVVIVE